MTAVAGTSLTGPINRSWVKFSLMAQYSLLLSSLRGVAKQGVLGRGEASLMPAPRFRVGVRGHSHRGADTCMYKLG